MQAQPGAVAPHLRDPHAEFRKGRWQRPAAFALVGAVALGGLFFLAPGEEKAPASAAAPKPVDCSESNGIGTSLPPERIVDDKAELTDHKARYDQRVAQENDKEAPARPAGIASDSEFSRAFKAAASH